MFVTEPDGPTPQLNFNFQGTKVTTIVTDNSTVKKQLDSLNENKAMGPDELHPNLLKETSYILSEPLAKIFNKTFEADKWKEANITAIFKNKGNRYDTTKYRPVSLTCIPGKLCEKNREVIVNHMEENNLFSDCQFGFRRKKNCVIQLLNVLNDFTRAYDEGKQVDTLYLDIKKGIRHSPP